MMKLFSLVIIFLFSSNLFAKNLSAHVHGSVHLDLATDKKQLLVLLKSPAESFLGFEYKAKTKKEKETVSKVKGEWTDNIISYLGSSSLTDCKITKSKWEQKFEGKSHSNIIAEAYVDCQKKVSGRTLLITLNSAYHHIKTIHLQLLREDGSVINKEFINNFEIKL